MSRISHHMNLAMCEVNSAILAAAKAADRQLLVRLVQLYTHMAKLTRWQPQQPRRAAQRRHRLVVWCLDGAVFDNANATKVFVDAMLYIGVERIAQTHMMYGAYELVSTHAPKRSRRYKQVGTWFVTVPPTTDEKARVINQLARKLVLPITASVMPAASPYRPADNTPPTNVISVISPTVPVPATKGETCRTM